MEIGALLLGTILVNNVVLTRFLGLCPFMGASSKLEHALGMGLATMFVLTVSSLCSHVLHVWVLSPLDAPYLRTIAFISIIAVVVQATELAIRHTSPLLYRALGVYIPLITTNCAVLGVALLSVQKQHSFLHAGVYGMGAALGFTLVLVLFSAMRERLAHADIPKAMQGAPIALVTAGMMSLAFMGFAGIGE